VGEFGLDLCTKFGKVTVPVGNLMRVATTLESSVPPVNPIRLASDSESGNALLDGGSLQTDLVRPCGTVPVAASREAEILALRHVLRRKLPKRPTFRGIDRLVFGGLYRLAPGVLNAPTIRSAGTARASESIGAGNPDPTAVGRKPHWRFASSFDQHREPVKNPAMTPRIESFTSCIAASLASRRSRVMITGFRSVLE
jgi:hypothetical protein